MSTTELIDIMEFNNPVRDQVIYSIDLLLFLFYLITQTQIIHLNMTITMT